MSLILDALKQADRERGRGTVRGVFGQTLHGPGEPAHRSSRRSPLVGWLAGAAGAAVLGVLAWPHTPWGAGPGAVLPPTPQAVTEPPPSTAAPAAPPSAAAALPAETALFRPAPALAPPRAATAPTPARSEAVQASPAPVPQARPAPPAPAHAAEPAPAQAPTAAELPAEARAQLPGVQISGHTYSDNAALRTLTIDGRMVVEGQAVAPGLRVERIGPHQAVFNHRGTRFSVDY